MRSVCSTLLLLACACGNLSNEDVAFLVAIPQKQQLHVQLPAQPAAQNACAIGPADIYASARTTGDSINAGVDAILALVDSILGVTPTSRDVDSRTWGPFPDSQHPGVQVQVVMTRELDASGTPWRFVYTISAARPPGAFIPLLEGEFFGAQARSGIGRVTLHFESSRQLGIAKPTDPAQPARIYYDLSSDPHTVSLDLTSNSGFGLVGFDYAFAGYADGHGRFDYAFPDPKSGCLLEVTTNFTARGAGRDVFRALCGAVVLGDVQQCWDVGGCLTFVDDPFALTAQCNGLKPCLLGTSTACP
ncbi:MAG TPA: hypothetical protein VFE90_22910 [Myxococcales bacterium]|jgi:hypothetical protein|nr:hypothetical protein [Myxococcales bacterium]